LQRIVPDRGAVARSLVIAVSEEGNHYVDGSAWFVMASSEPTTS
jgi:hypothetical protein